MLIIATNLKLSELMNPPDLAHARIYAYVLEHRAPVLFSGKNFREETPVSQRRQRSLYPMIEVETDGMIYDPERNTNQSAGAGSCIGEENRQDNLCCPHLFQRYMY